MTGNKSTPSHATPAYVCARIRRILAKHGLPLHKITGRYTPYFNRQTGTEGYSVRRIGFSKTVSVDYCGGYENGRTSDLPLGLRAEKREVAFTILRNLGYRIDSRGWIECDHYDGYR